MAEATELHRALLIIKLHVGKMMYARFKYMFACIVFFPMLLFNILFDGSALNTAALGLCCIFPYVRWQRRLSKSNSNKF